MTYLRSGTSDCPIFPEAIINEVHDWKIFLTFLPLLSWRTFNKQKSFSESGAPWWWYSCLCIDCSSLSGCDSDLKLYLSFIYFDDGECWLSSRQLRFSWRGFEFRLHDLLPSRPSISYSEQLGRALIPSLYDSTALNGSVFDAFSAIPCQLWPNSPYLSEVSWLTSYANSKSIMFSIVYRRRLLYSNLFSMCAFNVSPIISLPNKSSITSSTTL